MSRRPLGGVAVSKCGRCRGRRTIRELHGLNIVPCPDCNATGVKQRKPMVSRSGSVPLPEGARCIVCGEPAVHNHHPVKRQRIDRLVKPEARAEACKRDPRGVCPLCDPCHVLAEKEAKDKLELKREHLHPDFAAWVGEYNLFAGLPRYMMERAA